MIERVRRKCQASSLIILIILYHKFQNTITGIIRTQYLKYAPCHSTTRNQPERPPAGSLRIQKSYPRLSLPRILHKNTPQSPHALATHSTLHYSNTSTDTATGAVQLTSSSRVRLFNRAFRPGHMTMSCHVTPAHHVMLRPSAKQWPSDSSLRSIVTVVITY
jgi:hypothetical protein